ncbi:membrane protein implicated in regulation of membrane protease activity [Desulfosporosinus orientis DSM 765]|uniref:Membrane protein implicated in regulation of membrane protease activity n=1 Tax=Desulfosporosinus orientis (strain ATCC 19365 / DSM 765 / NCIMB 8382 / VKM B-1628 / Singapore I) TaxID=768706 RepID=G7W949_DESOD|nr:NfeD family protein [Desulfosporosinus orientis]AET68690.1 membrane protein implicated in regulation of membrane protease activity [Desulfosporosinus orientis DSM 765]
MLNIYWICFSGGVLFALVTLVFGDILGDIFGGIFDSLSMDHLDFLQPMVLVGGLTIFGGSGIMFNQHTNLDPLKIAVLSLMISIILSILLYFAYVKPMKNSENSTGFSLKDLVGKIGEVSVPIPIDGYGEVVIKVGAGNTNQIAANLEKVEIPAGTRVVVGEAKEGVLYVFPYES